MRPISTVSQSVCGARYAAMPIITKRELRLHFHNGFVPPGRDVDAGIASGDIEFVPTSGTTDERVVNIWHQPWWDASERASWLLNSHSSSIAAGHREAILASPDSVGVMTKGEPIPRDKRSLGRFLFLNEFFDPGHWTDAIVNRMLDELEWFAPETLEANPSHLSRFCKRVTELGRKAYQPRLVILTFEFPSKVHLRSIRRVFSCPTASSHGSTEAGYVFMECEHGRMHQNTASCRVDIEPVPGAGHGISRILVSTFDHPWFVLLRFDIGDLGRPAAAPCPCGRSTGLTLDAIEGRTKNLIRSSSGALITERMIDDAVSAIEAVQQYQLEQTAERSFVLRMEAVDGSSVLRAAADALGNLLGPGIEVKAERVPCLEPSPSGKFRLVLPTP